MPCKIVAKLLSSTTATDADCISVVAREAGKLVVHRYACKLGGPLDQGLLVELSA